MKKDKEVNDIDVGEDVSRNGEFIPTRFAWISLGYQKENAKRLQNITRKKDKEKKIKLYDSPYELKVETAYIFVRVSDNGQIQFGLKAKSR